MGWIEVGFGVVLGFALSEAKSQWSRKKRVKGYWKALQAEIRVCGEFAETFLRDKVAAPAYRIPTISYTSVFPALLAETALDYSDVRALILFYTQADSFNRGLDQTELARGDTNRLEGEYHRCMLKAEKLAPSEDPNTSYYANAMSVLRARVA